MKKLTECCSVKQHMECGRLGINVGRADKESLKIAKNNALASGDRAYHDLAGYLKC